MFGLLMRIFSFAFHFLLGFVMMAVGFVAWVSGHDSLQIGFLPWKGAALTYCLLFLGLAGVIITGFAVRRIIPVLFAVWSFAVLAMIVRGYFFSSYNFGFHGVRTAVCFSIAALLAFAGSVLQAWRKPAAARGHSAFA